MAFVCEDDANGRVREWETAKIKSIVIRCPHMQRMNCRSYKTGNAIIMGETCNRTATASQWMVIIHLFYRRQKVSFASGCLCEADRAWVSTRMTHKKYNIISLWMCEIEREMQKTTRRIYIERQLRLRFVRTEERIAVELSTTVCHSPIATFKLYDYYHNWHSLRTQRTPYMRTAQFDLCVTGDSCNYGRFNEYFCTYSP